MSGISDDREGVAAWRIALLAGGVGLSLGLATRAVPVDPTRSGPAFFGGLLAGLAAVLLLRSVRLRWVVTLMCLAGVVMLARFGRFGGASVAASPALVVWVFVTAASMAGATMIDVARHRPMRRLDEDPTKPAAGGADGGSRAIVARTVVVVGALSAAAAVGLGPALSATFDSGPGGGLGPDFSDAGRQNALTASDSLDMTSRPRLGDTVVLTVRADKASFWRTETYDQWDGSTWRRGDDLLTLVDEGGVRPSGEDIAALRGTPLVQTFTIEGRFANALPAAPSPVEIDADQPVVQHRDGNLVAGLVPLGQGARYTVVSRQLPVTDALLAGIGPGDVPTAILDRFATRPVTTDRVRRLAHRIADAHPTPLGKIRAIEAWMGANTRYSIDAPVTPRGTDAVDQFVFSTRLGWCEQVATTLAVMLREVGVPARLATGFVPGRFDPLTRRFQVRERDAHAWTEVWFPSVGWVGFDPTAEVPLAGDSDSQARPAGLLGWIQAHLVQLLVGPALVVAVGPAAARTARAAWRRRPRRRARRSRGTDEIWIARAEERLERIGRRGGRPRAPDESATRYGGVLALDLGDDRFAELGRMLERDRYGPGTPGEDERAAAEELLVALDRPSR